QFSTAFAPCLKHNTSAWAVASESDSTRLWARPMIFPSTTSTAPTGTSPFANAISASAKASRIKYSSDTNCPLLHFFMQLRDLLFQPFDILKVFSLDPLHSFFIFFRKLPHLFLIMLFHRFRGNKFAFFFLRDDFRKSEVSQFGQLLFCKNDRIQNTEN